MSRSIDGVVDEKKFFRPNLAGERSRAASRLSSPGSQKINLPAPLRGGDSPARFGRKPSSQKQSWKERLQLPLIIIGGMLAGFAIQSALLGQVLIVAYGVACLIYRIPSRVSFGLALAALSVTTGLLILMGNVMLSQTFATYTFLLLVVGVISLNRELKKEGGRVYSRRPRT